MLPRPSLLITAILLVAHATLAHAAPVGSHPSRSSEALLRSAQRRLVNSTIDSRRAAIEELERATLLDPTNAAAQLLLARTYYQCGFLQYAQHRFELVTDINPADADGQFGLGQVWRRDWLKYLEAKSLDRSIASFSTSARLKPSSADAWLQLVPLLLERGDLKPALAAATRAVEAEPRRPETVLALAHLSYRDGQVHAADSLFRESIPKLPKLARLRFEDISPVASERDTFTLHRLSPAGQREFIERFWRDNDPDLVSPENEARLEYWSRVAQAYFLYFDNKRREWDERGELYVRYGPPRKVEYNPIGERLSMSYQTGPAYPMNVLVWGYPELGMTVHLQDRLLSEYYLLPMSRDRDMDPQPHPDSLAKLGGQLAVTGGRGVFPMLPPGVKPMPVTGHIARFNTVSGPRLIADVEVAGIPSDSLWAEWVVIDSSRAEVARLRRRLAPSACDPAELRVADFAQNLRPGSYHVGITVHDEANQRRGVYRTEVALPDSLEALAMSDVVVSCGTPAVGSGPGVRIEPNAGARVSPGGNLTAYFEVYHLAPGDDGQSRFEYSCTVRSTERDARVWVQRLFAPRSRIPEVDISRSVENPGSIRRQFVSVPVQALPPGRYRLDVVVRDLIADTQTKGAAAFLKVPALTN